MTSDTLYPYPFPALSIRVKPGWLSHAERHGWALAKKRQQISLSSWDIAQRLGEIAFGAYYKLINDYPEIGKRFRGFPTRRGIIAAHTVPFDDRHRDHNFAALKVTKKWAREAFHVLGIYDPPFVDFLGWCFKTTFENAPGGDRGRTNISVRELNSMSTMLKGRKH